ncbi:MAG: glycosyltransferase family 2 protein [Deltaproteobacteria bacterium]|jgi:glycosyltransferase involved in cell wall biosynthesis|nr:glycosyltransferase family 2 protein [Deltaproteobacteria bacterium]
MTTSTTFSTSMAKGKGDHCQLTYVLITPARNEAAFIEQTIRSVVGQTIRPVKWVIVSDGSTDGTDEIVKKYTAHHDWIELLRMPERRDRHFGGKVLAFNAGYAMIKDLGYGIIGNLDADIFFEKYYMSFLLSKFAENPRLGIGGTPFREGMHQYDYRFTSIEHVSGACLLFRRECFETIGGYVPIKEGGEDLVAGLTARMKGWQTRTFLEEFCVHNRKMGSEISSGLMGVFRGGWHDYLMGGHPVWQFFRSAYQMSSRPFVVYGCVLLAGYLWAMLTQAERPVSREIVAFRRKEQMSKLREFFRYLLFQRGLRHS